MNITTTSIEVPNPSPAVRAEKERRGYSQKDILHIMFGSFRFSRGNSTAQKRIFEYLAHNYGNWLDPEVILSCAEPLGEMAIKYMNRGHRKFDSYEQYSTMEEVKKESNKQLEKFAGMLPWPSHCPFNLSNTRNGLIIADEIWLPQFRIKTHTPPYRSNLVTHGLLGKSTGREEFDLMFRDVVANILGPNNFGETKIPEIFRDHLAENPDDTVLVELRLRSALAPHLTS